MGPSLSRPRNAQGILMLMLSLRFLNNSSHLYSTLELEPLDHLLSQNLMPHFNPYIPSGTQSQSFLSPDFTPIQFPSGTPAVPLQPQYLSSDGGSSTPSTPASTRSTSSNSGSGERSKARTYDRDPKYPDDALYWHSKHNGKCPDCKQADSLTKPKWHSHKKRLFIKVRGYGILT